MKPQIITGIFAHVDAGKTTLSEALLYEAGCLRSLGRVDRQNTFLDTETQEKERGITIFSKQAVLPLDDFDLVLTDTPGHVDFSGEAERVLSVLDYAILVISGTDGVQSHTRTLWQLLQRFEIPTFIFVNKMDLPTASHSDIMRELQRVLSADCVDFSLHGNDAFWEEIALKSEALTNRYLEGTMPSPQDMQALVASRRLFPCFFGSALRQEGVGTFFSLFQSLVHLKHYPASFGAQVYKITRDAQNTRLTWLKVTGGSLRVKQMLEGTHAHSAQPWQEKADHLRLYSGARFSLVEEVPAGCVCAVAGLSCTWAGEGLGMQADAPAAVLEPVLCYRVLALENVDAHTILSKLRILQEEEPGLRVSWNEARSEILVHLMGEVQLEIVTRLFFDRFGISLSFDEGTIAYKETISDTVEGIGHFEPLRHYAEVRLLLSPGEPGSGIRFANLCPEDTLARNWQNLIFTHLSEKEHIGVLTGSPVTDIVFTLVSGKSHLKHTEGGDFRQATYRAVRHGLMQAQSVLLEPWYSFRLELSQEHVGRAMSDLQRMGASFSAPEIKEEQALLIGSAPVSAMRGYPLELTAYTRGTGRIFFMPDGYRPCHNEKEVIEQSGYDAERDVENTADSVFCSHGAGYNVPWREVASRAHTGSVLSAPEASPSPQPSRRQVQKARDPLALDAELAKIFERTYGAAKSREAFRPSPRACLETLWEGDIPEYLLVDGYNVIFAWDELREAAACGLDGARQMLADILCNYRGCHSCEVILVYDAYRVKGNPGTVVPYHNIHIVYTKEAETADMYIEKATFQLARKRKVRVVTSDGMEQMIILGHGALRVSAQMFREEVALSNAHLRETIERSNAVNDRRF